jgi:hypothetical protein
MTTTLSVGHDAGIVLLGTGDGTARQIYPTDPAYTNQYCHGGLFKWSDSEIRDELDCPDMIGVEHRYRAELRTLVRDLGTAFTLCRRRNAVLYALASLPEPLQLEHMSAPESQTCKSLANLCALEDNASLSPSASKIVNVQEETWGFVKVRKASEALVEAPCPGQDCESSAAPTFDRSASPSDSENSSSTIRPWTADGPSTKQTEVCTVPFATGFRRANTIHGRTPNHQTKHGC